MARLEDFYWGMVQPRQWAPWAQIPVSLRPPQQALPLGPLPIAHRQDWNEQLLKWWLWKQLRILQMTEAVEVGLKERRRSWQWACVEVEAMVQVVAAAPARGGGELLGAECDGEDPRQSQCHPFISAYGEGCSLSPGCGPGKGSCHLPLFYQKQGGISLLITCLFSKVPITVDKKIESFYRFFLADLL